MVNAVERRYNQEEAPRYLCFYCKQSQLLTLSLIVSSTLSCPVSYLYTS